MLISGCTDNKANPVPNAHFPRRMQKNAGRGRHFQTAPAQILNRCFYPAASPRGRGRAYAPFFTHFIRQSAEPSCRNSTRHVIRPASAVKIAVVIFPPSVNYVSIHWRNLLGFSQSKPFRFSTKPLWKRYRPGRRVPSVTTFSLSSKTV